MLQTLLQQNEIKPRSSNVDWTKRYGWRLHLLYWRLSQRFWREHLSWKRMPAKKQTLDRSLSNSKPETRRGHSTAKNRRQDEKKPRVDRPICQVYKKQQEGKCKVKGQSLSQLWRVWTLQALVPQATTAERLETQGSRQGQSTNKVKCWSSEAHDGRYTFYIRKSY